MKYAKRMVLVPETEYLGRRKGNTKTITTTKKKQSDYIAAKALVQKRGKAVRMRDQGAARLRHEWANIKSPPEPMAHVSSLYNESKPESSSPPAAFNLLDVVRYLPAVNQPKARLLLADLMAKGYTWTENKELVLPYGETIRHSNIVDLLREAIVTSKAAKRSGMSTEKPPGWQAFIASIAMAGVPTSLFTKPSTLRSLAEQEDLSPTRWEEYSSL